MNLFLCEALAIPQTRVPLRVAAPRHPIHFLGNKQPTDPEKSPGQYILLALPQPSSTCTFFFPPHSAAKVRFDTFPRPLPLFDEPPLQTPMYLIRALGPNTLSARPGAGKYSRVLAQQLHGQYSCASRAQFPLAGGVVSAAVKSSAFVHQPQLQCAKQKPGRLIPGRMEQSAPAPDCAASGTPSPLSRITYVAARPSMRKTSRRDFCLGEYDESLVVFPHADPIASVFIHSRARVDAPANWMLRDPGEAQSACEGDAAILDQGRAVAQECIFEVEAHLDSEETESRPSLARLTVLRWSLRAQIIATEFIATVTLLRQAKKKEARPDLETAQTSAHLAPPTPIFDVLYLIQMSFNVLPRDIGGYSRLHVQPGSTLPEFGRSECWQNVESCAVKVSGIESFASPQRHSELAPSRTEPPAGLGFGAVSPQNKAKCASSGSK
ncbi:hypothetical protein DFH09DRAFT_1102929 [Mycena vulgaris]|nr:hypothetical protein DFH09DRAFT_1102929 [Mycena vulgaris]